MIVAHVTLLPTDENLIAYRDREAVMTMRTALFAVLCCKR